MNLTNENTDRFTLIEKETTQTTIIPVAGGKGGVGKSLLTANLAIALSQLGMSTVAVDLDFGGSNLHHYLGSRHNNLGLGDFLATKNTPLHEFLASTGYPNLKLLPGDGKKLFMSNLPYTQKQKLLKEISKIPTDYVLVDLGAGSSFNNLDFFSLADRGILVTTPDLPAAMNLLVFLKNHVFRKIWKCIRHDKKLDLKMKDLVKHIGLKSMSVNTLIDELSSTNPSIRKDIQHICQTIKPRIIINMGNHPDDLNFFESFASTIQKRLSIQVEFFGFILYDNLVRTAVNNKSSLASFPTSSVAFDGITLIAERVKSLWNQDIEDSFDRLFTHSEKFYNSYSKVAC